MSDSRRTILAIDDTPANLHTLGATLTEEFRLVIATSGTMGLALARQSAPDLILLDLMMPEMNGHETYRHISSDTQLKSIPVIFITALAESDAESEGLALGAADFITKPINVKVARQRIINLLERERLRKEIELHRDHLDALVEARTKALSLAKEAAESANRAKTELLENLKSSEERLRLAKIAANLGIYDLDIPTGNLALDDRAKSIWGFGPDDPVNYAALIQGIHADDRMAMENTINLAINPHSNGEYHAEFRVVNRSDGSVRHVAANGRASFMAENATRVVSTVKDITEQKRLEKLVMERRSEMELLIHRQIAVHTAAAIAHELNQPLNSISTYSEVALRMLQSGKENREKMAHALTGAVEQSQRAGQKLHELLDFLHKGEIVSEQIDLNQVVLESLAMAEENGHGGFRPRLELAPDLPAVQANRLQVQKVLINLLLNSFEAMRAAEVPSNTIAIKVKILAEDNMAKVTVHDTGPGIDPETYKGIFEPFFSTKPNGIGLGLAISRALIEAHGGQLWVDQKLKPGAAVHFTLPFAS
ncbi:MAG: response regulator [Sterolibacterium sp.]